MLNLLEQLELYAKGSEPGAARQARRDPGSRAERLQEQRLVRGEVAQGARDRRHLRRDQGVGNASNLEGKTLITSAVDENGWPFPPAQVNLVIDVSPKLFEKVVGINTIEAMILAALDKSPRRFRTTTSRKSSTN